MAYRYGNNFSEYLAGTDSDDYVYGYGGNDTLDGWNGVDVMLGGDGDDWVYGGRGSDWLYGGTGNDQLFGQEDNDRFLGAVDGSGDDTFHGDGGYDTVDYAASAGGVVIALHLGKASAGANGKDTLDGIENAVGSEYSDIIHGTDAGFLGIGGWGENALYGLGGHDNIFGRSGNDWLYGGAGIDGLNGGDGNDTLYGEADADYLYGNNDNDKLYSGDGNDWLFGGYGDDHLDGGGGYDTVSYADATSEIDMGWDTQGKDTFANVEAVVGSNYDDEILAYKLPANYGYKLDGGKGADALIGSDGNDLIIGGDGNDYISGERGSDVLLGGAGADWFSYWDLPTDNLDAIADFQHGVDGIEIGIFEEAGTLSFIGQSAFTHQNQVRYGYLDYETTVVQVNLDTDAAAEFEIQLYGAVSLDQSDFSFESLSYVPPLF
jgi:Ca2+-binding RTX toxin-like protein